jgi:hypothetical protein
MLRVLMEAKGPCSLLVFSRIGKIVAKFQLLRVYREKVQFFRVVFLERNESIGP